jgi:hypothetical protein
MGGYCCPFLATTRSPRFWIDRLLEFINAVPTKVTVPVLNIRLWCPSPPDSDQESPGQRFRSTTIAGRKPSKNARTPQFCLRRPPSIETRHYNAGNGFGDNSHDADRLISRAKAAEPSVRHWALGCRQSEVLRHYSRQDWHPFAARNCFVGDTRRDGKGGVNLNSVFLNRSARAEQAVAIAAGTEPREPWGWSL